MTKRFFNLLSFLVLFFVTTFSSCVMAVSTTDFSISIKNEYTAAYFIEMEYLESDSTKSKTEFVGYVNQNKTSTFDFKKGSVVKKINLYSGIDLEKKTQKLQITYTTPISKTTDFVIRDNKIYKQ